MSPKVVIEWLTLLFRIPKVPGSNLGPEIDYPDSGFSEFSSAPPGDCLDSTLKLGHDRFLPNSFLFVITYRSFIRRYTALVTTERSSQNKIQINKLTP
jgi:hypothetical protein